MYRPRSGAVMPRTTISAISWAQPANVIRTSRGRAARRRGTRPAAPRAPVRRCSRRSPDDPGRGLVRRGGRLEVELLVRPDDAIAAVDECDAHAEERDRRQEDPDICHVAVLRPDFGAEKGLDAFLTRAPGTLTPYGCRTALGRRTTETWHDEPLLPTTCPGPSGSRSRHSVRCSWPPSWCRSATTSPAPTWCWSTCSSSYSAPRSAPGGAARSPRWSRRCRTTPSSRSRTSR